MQTPYPTSYAVFDYETTGLDTATCEPIEMAILVVRDGEVTERHSTLIKITGEIHEKALETHHITKEQANAEGVTCFEALALLLSVTRGLPVIGHNIIAYDNHIVRTRLRHELRELMSEVNLASTQVRLVAKVAEQELTRLLSEFEANCMDTAAMFRNRYVLPGMTQGHRETVTQFHSRILAERTRGKYNLAIACETLGIDTSDLTAHRAAGDVEMTRRVYEKLIAQTK